MYLQDALQACADTGLALGFHVLAKGIGEPEEPLPPELVQAGDQAELGGGELFASTPTSLVLRVLLALGSLRWRRARQQQLPQQRGVSGLDATQAVVHADDLLTTRPAEVMVELSGKLQGPIVIRQIGQLERSGDELTLVGRVVRLRDDGLEAEEDWALSQSLSEERLRSAPSVSGRLDGAGVTIVTSSMKVESNMFMIAQDEAPEELEEEDVRATIVLWTVIGAGVLRIIQWGWQLSCAVATRCGYRPLRQQRPTELPGVAAASGGPATTPERRSARQRAMTPFRAGRQTPYVCECGFRLEAREVTSETSPNCGRLYVSCQRSRADPQRCVFFRWL